MGLSALVLCVFFWNGRRRVPAEVEASVEEVQSVDTVTVLVVGDIISHWAVQKSAERYGYSSFFKYIEKDLAEADIAIGNMEFPLAGPPYTGYPKFSGSDDFARYLKDVGFDVLLTANNHMLDKGSEGLRRTLDALERMDIPYTGTAADTRADTLINPLFVSVKGVILAFVNATYGTNCAADVRWPKVLRLNRETLTPILRRARERADFVLVFPHWGEEYQLRHSDKQEEMARWLVEQGADAIVGGHPHVVQDYQEIEGVPVVYSLGNALSNQNDLPARLGAAVTLKIVIPGGEKPQLLSPSYTYLWCTKPGMVEDSYAAVPVTLPAGHWRVLKDYENMQNTYTRLKEGGFLPGI
ncbi:MAG: CapA family protein [Bacteroidales bacterium]|nr:CapA family protein [Bacteroidales bacterium]